MENGKIPHSEETKAESSSVGNAAEKENEGMLITSLSSFSIGCIQDGEVFIFCYFPFWPENSSSASIWEEKKQEHLKMEEK